MDRRLGTRGLGWLWGVALLAGCGKSNLVETGYEDPGELSGVAGTSAQGGQGAGPSQGGAPSGAAGMVFVVGGAGGTFEAAGAAGMPGVAPMLPSYAVTGSWPNRPVVLPTASGDLTYTKVTVHDRFLAESCAIGDYDGDGQPDISSGRRWYPGPAFATEHLFRGGHDDLPRAGLSPEMVTGVSDDYADYAFDMDGDGDADIINVASPDVDETQTPNPAPMPQAHATAYWYENPGPALVGAATTWTAHRMHSDVRHKQHGFGDVDGDGKPELYGACRGCSPLETLGYYRGDWSKPTAPWTYHAVTEHVEFPFGGTGKLHGLGFGDVNQDGKLDLLERKGVWIDIQAAAPNPLPCPAVGCGFIPIQLYGGGSGGQLGGAHMFAFDVDGDGDGDIVSAELAHNYGVSWYEQTTPGQFTKHRIAGSPQDPGSTGVVFSQPHAVEVADMDGDGVRDIITGKSYLAHPNGYGDPDLMGQRVVYVFRTVRHQPSATDSGAVTFEPHLIDGEVGIGQQIAVGHLNLDGTLDLCIASKLGLYVFLGHNG
jgi:hypothetical protein